MPSNNRIKELAKALNDAKARKELQADLEKANLKAKKEKHLTAAEAFILVARDKRSFSHHLFEWEDSHAAHLYRLQQANDIILRCKVRIHEVPKIEQKFSVAVQDSTITAGTVPATIKTRVVSLELDIWNAFDELFAVLNKYHSLKELNPIREVLAEVKNDLQQPKYRRRAR